MCKLYVIVYYVYDDINGAHLWQSVVSVILSAPRELMNGSASYCCVKTHQSI